MKKILVGLVVLLSINFLFSQETEEQMVEEYGWNASCGIMLNVSAAPEQTPVSNVGETRFNSETCFGGVIPVLQGAVSYTMPLNFGDNLLFSGANVSFGYSPVITPVSLMNQLSVKFVPIPIFSFDLGCSFDTCWPIGDMECMGVYNKESKSYSTINPFTGWQMKLNGGVNFQFDFGLFYPSDWSHIITTAGYSIEYTRFLNASDGELWQFMGGKDNINAFKYSSSAMLGYMLPVKCVNAILGVSYSWSGYLESDAYKKYGYDYDCDFVDMTLSLVGTVSIKNKHSILTSISFPSRRTYTQKIGKDESLLNKKVAGREWYFGTILIAWQMSLL